MNKRMMVQSVAAAEGHDPRHVGLIATDAAGETVELVFPTPEIPGVVSGLLRAAMLAAGGAGGPVGPIPAIKHAEPPPGR